MHVATEGDRTIVVQGTTDAQRISELVAREQEEIRSLKGIKAVDVTADATLIRLH